MVSSRSPSAGWLSTEIESAIDEVAAKSYIPQAVKDGFNQARGVILGSKIIAEKDRNSNLSIPVKAKRHA
ncbi:MAG: hypothetical protein J0H01_19900 [Rhizobiales bacterium]|nr:hypothetical protein [Hyphomicrobiales bacterium]